MDIKLIHESKTPLYMQIKNSIKNKIMSREFLCGFKLPPERVLAKQLSVHRNTIIRAYGALIDEGLIRSSVNPRGYIVVHEFRDQEEVSRSIKPCNPLNYMIKDEFLQMDVLFNKLFGTSIQGKIISFAADTAPPETYPKEQLKTIFTQLMEEEKYDIFGYCSPQGTEVLRNSIVHILSDRQIKTTASEIQIVSETYQALDYILKLFISPGDTIIVEEPVITDCFNFFQLMGVNVITVPMDGDGMLTEYLEQLILKYNPKFIYTIPTFHNPSSAVMSLERRYQLLELSYKYDVPIIEEDCDSVLRFDGTAIPSLKAMDKSGSVIYIDSFIFSAYPGARIGYVVAPKQVVTKMSRLLEMNQIFVNSMGQYAISEFIDRGYYDKHLQRLQEYYQKKRDVMCGALQSISDMKLEFSIPQGGTCIWCRLPERVNQSKLLIDAHKRGVSFAPGFLFYPYGNQGENYMRLSYGGASEEQIETGIGILAEAIRASAE